MSKKDFQEIRDQWNNERPDIDPEVMVVCGSVWRAAETLKKGVVDNLAKYGLDFPMCDVLLTLRRQGKNQVLTPSALSKEMFLSSSAMTNRLDKLEKKGLIERVHDSEDRRSVKVVLSIKGFELADEIVVTHVATEEKLLSPLSKEEREMLRSILHKIY